VRIIEGVEWEIPAMTGDNTQRCRCGLELRAPTGRELLEVIARHNGACIVLCKPDHWSVKNMLRQNGTPHLGWACQAVGGNVPLGLVAADRGLAPATHRVRSESERFDRV
jgi:hypothetical protein